MGYIQDTIFAPSTAIGGAIAIIRISGPRAGDAEKLLEKIREEYGGELPFDDKADPEVIREVFGLSKAAFKRAVGHLYRERRVALSGGKILCRSDA